jgi:hypothetical protein
VIRVRALQRTEVVAAAQAVVDVSAIAPAATWEDVERHQRRVRRAAATEAALAPAMDTLGRTIQAQREPWFVTRTWWYATVVQVLLGSEWIVRRTLRRR